MNALYSKFTPDRAKLGYESSIDKLSYESFYSTGDLKKNQQTGKRGRPDWSSIDWSSVFGPVGFII